MTSRHQREVEGPLGDRSLDAGRVARAGSDPERPASSEDRTSTRQEPTSHLEDPLRGSRTSGVWVATVGLGIVLLLLIIFIAQNNRRTTVTFLAWDGQTPVAVAMLIAAAAGLSVAVLAGMLRILQLRRRVRSGRR